VLVGERFYGGHAMSPENDDGGLTRMPCCNAATVPSRLRRFVTVACAAFLRARSHRVSTIPAGIIRE